MESEGWIERNSAEEEWALEALMARERSFLPHNLQEAPPRDSSSSRATNYNPQRREIQPLLFYSRSVAPGKILRHR